MASHSRHPVAPPAHAALLAVGAFAGGVTAGVAWLNALLPVTVTGAIGYDAARYGFASCVVVALAALFYRPWRKFGLVAALFGLAVGIFGTARAMELKLTTRDPAYFSAIIFGSLLSIVTFASACLLVARLFSEWRKRAGHSLPSSAPRRFGTGTLMFVVLLVSFFFAISQWLELPPSVSVTVATFTGLIAGLQMWLQGLPRAASVGAGALLVPVAAVVTYQVNGGSTHPVWVRLTSTLSDITFVVAHLVLVGALLGYVAGALVAGLFLERPARSS